ISLGLAVARQEAGWEGRIGVFSAPLDTGDLGNYLPQATVLESEGRQFPVDVTHLRPGAREPIWESAANGFKAAIKDGAQSDVLLFMPGKYEINKSVEAISHLREARGWDVFPLHGELDAATQDRAIGTGERPRVIVSTNIAETSLTLPGIRTVIDSGLARVPDFDARRGVNTLLTEKISRASADQRAGRAGRVAPGRCYRLWTESDHVHRPAYTAPEIERLDLSETRLRLLNLEMESSFNWFEKPPAEAWEHAGELLQDLGAMQEGKITETGREMVRYPLHPRFSRLLVAARQNNCMDLVLAAIAISEGRDLILPLNDRYKARERESWWEAAEGVSDLLKGVLAWQRVVASGGGMAFCREWGIHAHGLNQAMRVFQQLKRLAGDDNPSGPISVEAFAKTCLTGYVDHLARRLDRGTLRCQMVHGRRGELRKDSIVDKADLFVAAEVEEREYRGEATLFLGGITAIDESWLEEVFPGELKTETVDHLDPARRRVERVERTVFRALTLREKGDMEPDSAAASQVLAQAIVENNWPLKKWDAAAENWIRRVNVLARHCPEWELKPITEEDRLLFIEQICEGASSYKQVKDREVLPILKTWLPDTILPLLEDWVPVRFALPGKGQPKLRYEEDGTVVLPARIQQLYDVPGKDLAICQGRCRLKIELLAPNNRPVQITDDLDGFWEGQYPQVRKDLFGRYPKHEWR
ncbi:MAG: ATP-dependent helicase C-terminal domain-containing protein, partial [Puniceicoccaceae bacterium]